MNYGIHFHLRTTYYTKFLLIPFIDHAFCLFLASWKDADFYDFDKWCEADAALYCRGDATTQIQEVDVSGCFNIDTQGVFAVQVRDTDLIFAGYFREFFEYLFNLAREYVDTFDLHHVIGSAHNRIKTWEWTSARAGSRDNAGQIMGAVTNERCPFFDKGGDYNFAKFSVRQRF